MFSNELFALRSWNWRKHARKHTHTQHVDLKSLCFFPFWRKKVSWKLLEKMHLNTGKPTWPLPLLISQQILTTHPVFQTYFFVYEVLENNGYFTLLFMIQNVEQILIT